MAQILYPYLIEVSLTGIVTLVLLSFFVSGGVARNAAAQFALGTFDMLLGLLFLSVFFSEEARQTDFPYSDYYANNWIAGGFCLWSGSTALIFSLIGFGLRRRTALPLVLGNPIVFALILAVVVPWKWPLLSLSGPALDAGALIALGIILAGKKQWRPAVQILVLAGGGIFIVWLFSTFLGSYYQDGLGRNAGPPYVDGPVTMLSLGMGLLIFLACRAWINGPTNPKRIHSPGPARHQRMLVSTHQQSPNRERDHTGGEKP